MNRALNMEHLAYLSDKRNYLHKEKKVPLPFAIQTSIFISFLIFNRSDVITGQWQIVSDADKQEDNGYSANKERVYYDYILADTDCYKTLKKWVLSSIAVTGRVYDNNEMASNVQDVERCDDRNATSFTIL